VSAILQTPYMKIKRKSTLCPETLHGFILDWRTARWNQRDIKISIFVSYQLHQIPENATFYSKATNKT
jgi:hypothetical protein